MALIVSFSCLGQNDEQVECTKIITSTKYDDCIKKNTLETNRQLEQIVSRFEVQVSEAYQADPQLGNDLIKTVLESHKSWLSYRDKHCKVIAFEIEEGTTAYITIINSCVIELNEKRMEQLNQIL